MQKKTNMAKIQRSLEMDTEIQEKRSASHEAVNAFKRKCKNIMEWDFQSLKSSETSLKKNSKTVPDQTMSIEELIRRFASGQPLTKSPLLDDQIEIYDEEDEYPDFLKMDLSEQHDYAEELAERHSSKARADNNPYPKGDSRRLPGSGEQPSERSEQFPPSAAEVEKAPQGN